MSETNSGLSVSVTADIASANNALKSVETAAKKAGDAATVNLSKIETLLEDIKGSSAAAANALGKGFSQAAPDVSKYEQALAKAQKQIDKLQAQMAKMQKMPSAPSSKPTDEYGKSLDELRAKFNPLFAVGQKYKQTIAEIAEAEKRGALSTYEAAQARRDAAAAANAQMVINNRLQSSLGTLNGATRLSSNQMLNLSRQMNDVATMAALGAPPMQIFASQIGQIYGALEEGPRGVRGSIEAIKNGVVAFAASLGPAGLALAGLTAAAGAFAYMTWNSLEPIEDVVKKQTSAVKALEQAYKIAGDASEDYGKRAVKAQQNATADLQRESISRIQEMSETQLSNSYSGRDNFRRREFDSYREINNAVNDYLASVRRGTPEVAAFDSRMADLRATAESQGGDVLALWREWETFLETVTPLAGVVDRTAVALSASARAALQAKEDLKGLRQEMGRFIQDGGTAAQQIENIYQRRLAASSNSGASPRAREGMEIEFARQRNEALRNLDRESLERLMDVEARRVEATRSSSERQISEITRRYEREIEEANRTNGSLNTIKNLELAREQEIALVREEAGREAAKQEDDYRKALQSRLTGMQQNIDGLRLENQLFGTSEGVIAAARFEMQALAAAKQAAADAGRPVSQEEIAAIQSGAQEIAAYTDQLKAMNEQKRVAENQRSFFESLDFETRTAGMSSAEVGYLRRLEAAQIDVNSEIGKSAIEQMRYNDSLKQTEKQMIDFADIGESAFDALNDSLKEGGSLLDGLTSMFAKLTNQLASQAFGKMFGGLFGQTGQGKQNGLPGINVGGWGQQAASIQAPSYTPSYTANNQNVKAQTDKLAVTVTNTVSTNLLGSFLGAGKSKEHLTGLNQTFAQALSNMLSSAPEAVKASVQINSGFRSVARQSQLWEQALKKYGDPSIARKWVAPPGRSNHGKGMAADLGYSANSAAKEWFHQNASKYGLAFPLSNEDWHIELASARGGKGVTQTAQAVSAGVIDASKKMANGQAGVSTYSGAGGVNVSTGGAASGGGQAGQAGGGGILGGFLNKQLTQPGTFLGMQTPGLTVGGAIGAGFGGFSSGYQSGSPISGGLTGGLSGFMTGGPVGGLIGLAGGLLGGIFGGRAQRKQKHQEAAAKWAEMLPQYEQFRQQLQNGPIALTGIAQNSRDMRGEIDKFHEVGSHAWKYGKGANLANFQKTEDMLSDYNQRMQKAFRVGFDSMIADVAGGAGFDGPYLKAAQEMQAFGQRVNTFVEDTEFAFGKAAPQITTAKNAALEFGMNVISGAEGMSQVETRLREMTGQMNGLIPIFEKLGLTAEQAANSANEAYARGFAKLQKDFISGMQDEINSINDKGYLTDFRNLIDDFASRLNDAVLLGVDRSIVDKWFKAQAQDIVDGTELAGASLQELVNMFPQLSGIVRDSMQVLQESFDKAEGKLREAYNKERSELDQTISRVEAFSESLKKFREDLKIDNRLSTLSPADRLAEAQKQFLETAEKANQGDEDSQAELIGVTQEYLNNAKEYYATSEGYFNAFNEVQAILANTDVKAKEQIDTAKLQLDSLKQTVGKLIDIDDSVLSVADAIKQFNEAQAARDHAQAVSLQQYVQALNPQTALPPAQTPQITAPPAAGGSNPAAQKSYANYFDGNGYARYAGEYKTVNGVRILVPDGMSDSRAWQLYVRTQQERNKNDMPGGRQMGGLIGAYAAGGVIANGIYNQDSVIARLPNGKPVGLAGGEFVTRATSVTPNTKGILDYINRTGQTPQMTNDNRQEMAGLREEIKALKQVVAFGLQENVNAVERGNNIAQDANATQKLTAFR